MNTRSIPPIIILVFLPWSCSDWYFETKKNTTNMWPWVRNALIQYSSPSKGYSFIYTLYSFSANISLNSLRNFYVESITKPSTFVPLTGTSATAACASAGFVLPPKLISWKRDTATATTRNTVIPAFTTSVDEFMIDYTYKIYIYH